MKYFKITFVAGLLALTLSACDTYYRTIDPSYSEPAPYINNPTPVAQPVYQQPVYQQPVYPSYYNTPYPAYQNNDRIVNIALLPSGAIRNVQSALHSRGFNPGNIDGVYGSDTANAMARFQSSIGRPGPVTSSVLAALGVNYTYNY